MRYKTPQRNVNDGSAPLPPFLIFEQPQKNKNECYNTLPSPHKITRQHNKEETGSRPKKAPHTAQHQTTNKWAERKVVVVVDEGNSTG